MHAIKDRPMAVNGQVVILPMMYLALSYDHRLIDGRESVGYLVTVKRCWKILLACYLMYKLATRRIKDN